MTNIGVVLPSTSWLIEARRVWTDGSVQMWMET